MIIQIGNKTLKVSLVDNDSTKALIEKLQNGPLTIKWKIMQVWKSRRFRISFAYK